MGNPGTFIGSRGTFLEAQKEAYTAAVVGGYIGDCIADIQRRYFKRYPIELPHEVEPDPDFMAAVDDNAPDPEVVGPNEETMDAEEFEAAKKAWKARKKLLKLRKGQIKRRMAYMHSVSKDTMRRTSKTGADDPMKSLVAKLTDISVVKPRQSIAYNLWAAANVEVVEKAFEAERRRLKPENKKLVSLRSNVTRSLFRQLPEDVQKEWEAKAKEEHEAAVEAWTEKLERSASTAPEDRQRVIEGLTAFAMPILDLICEHSGMKASLIVGGPEPADGGRINVISIHSGSTLGDVKLNFGQAERAAYKNVFVPMYGRFLKKCYTVEECRERALPDHGTTLQSSLAEEALDSTTVHSADWSRDTPPLPGSAAPGVPSTSSGPPLAPSSKPPSPPPSPGIPPRPESPPPTQPSLRAPASPGCSTPEPSLSIASSSRLSSSSPSVRATPSPSPCAAPASPGCSTPRPSLPTASPSRPSSSSSSVRVTPSASAPAVSAAPAPAASLSSTPSLAHLQQPTPSPLWPPIACLTPQQPTSSLVSSAEGAPSSLPITSNTPTVALPPQAVRSPTPMARAQKRKSVAEEVEPGRDAKRQKQEGLRQVSAVSGARRVSGSNAGGSGASARGGGIASSSTSARPLTPHTNAPKWFLSASSMPRSGQFGDSWLEAVSTWEEFEAAEGFEGSLKLGTSQRPAYVSWWIQRARSQVYRPKITNFDEVAAKFKAWWQSLQPDWRVTDDGALARGEGSWDALRRPGVNGLLSVMAALFFWAYSVGEENANTAALELAIEDVSWALQELVKFIKE